MDLFSMGLQVERAPGRDWRAGVQVRVEDVDPISKCGGSLRGTLKVICRSGGAWLQCPWSSVTWRLGSRSEEV